MTVVAVAGTLGILAQELCAGGAPLVPTDSPGSGEGNAHLQFSSCSFALFFPAGLSWVPVPAEMCLCLGPCWGNEMVRLGAPVLRDALRHRSSLLGAVGTGAALLPPGGGTGAEVAQEQRCYPAGGGI